jgi:phosphoribosyl-ATP pyrophosphohydrolase/phosphoribosyl-AMP cyclohydrolase
MNGRILGMFRTKDAPIFGTDVSVQKARSAAFLSHAQAGARLRAAGLGSYVDRVAGEPAEPRITLNGQIAYADRSIGFLAQLERVIASRIAESPEGSYTAKRYASGIKRMAQKVGEEGVETALAAQAGDNAELVSESADLLFHLALLLKARGLSLDAVVAELASRHRPRA